MINAGNYDKRIVIIKKKKTKDDDGFKTDEDIIILNTFAKIKTIKGFTLITNNSDFEKAYTNFTIRYPKVKVTRDMYIRYKDKSYSIEYLNNIDEKDVELEIQAKEITK